MSRTALLQEIFVQFSKYSPFGNIIIVASELGTDQGLILKNQTISQGKGWGLCELKKQATNAEIIRKSVFKANGVDIFDDKSTPEWATKIHQTVKALDLEKAWKDTLIAEFATSPKESLPNMLFDIKLKSPDQLPELINNIKSATANCYDNPKNIHLVWVVNDIETAIQQHNNCVGTVSANSFNFARHSISSSIAALLHPSSNIQHYVNGKIVFMFNQTKMDYVIKDIGEPVKRLEEIAPHVLQSLLNHIPVTAKAAWELALMKANTKKS